jgi:hypothetical protein
MSPALTDAQLTAITNAARPLLPRERTGVLAALFEELLGRCHGYPIGDGKLHRTFRDLQRRHFRPPWETEDTRGGARPRDFATHV